MAVVAMLLAAFGHYSGRSGDQRSDGPSFRSGSNGRDYERGVKSREMPRPRENQGTIDALLVRGIFS